MDGQIHVAQNENVPRAPNEMPVNGCHESVHESGNARPEQS